MYVYIYIYIYIYILWVLFRLYSVIAPGKYEVPIAFFTIVEAIFLEYGSVNSVIGEHLYSFVYNTYRETYRQ